MNLNRLHDFQVLAEIRHYTQAARKLSITQPALTNAINALEEELGAPLFIHEGRKVELSPCGEVFLPHVNQIFSELKLGISRVENLKKQQENTIRLSYIDLLEMDFIPALARSFSEAEGERAPHFEMRHATTGEALRLLRQDALDFAFCLNIREEPDLAFLPVQERDFVLLAPEGHPLLEKETVTLKDLEPYPFIHYSRDSGMRSLTEGILQGRGVLPEKVSEAYNEMDIIGLVSYGKGISLVPEMPVLQYFAVGARKIEDLEERCSVCLAFRADRELAGTRKRFLDFCREACGGERGKDKELL